MGPNSLMALVISRKIPFLSMQFTFLSFILFFLIGPFHITSYSSGVVSMAGDFNILTINVRGTIKDFEKRNKLLACAQLNNINVILMQETHVSGLNYKKKIDKIFDCKSYWSFGTSDSKGVAILLLNNFKREILKFDRDIEGRIVAVKIRTDWGDLNIVNVYSPNNIAERKTFFKKIDRYLIGTIPSIIGGDWNMVENINLDKINGNHQRGNEGVSELNSLKSAYSLNDPYRKLYKSERTFTWSCETTGVRTRLDRYYINEGIMKNVVSVKNVSCNVSDHLGVKIEFNELPTLNFNLGKGLWKFNNSLLKDDNFCKEIEEKWLERNSNNQEKNVKWWEDTKQIFKEIAIKHGKQNVKKYHEALNECEEGIRLLNSLLVDCNDPELKDRINEEKNLLSDQIDILYKEKYNGAIIRARCDILTNNEDASSNFLRMEASNSKKLIIKEVKDKNGNLTKNSSETMQAGLDFYKDLFKFEDIDENTARYFTANLPQVPNDLANMCETPLSNEESKQSAMSMDNDKSPGSDGLTAEFYKHFWYLIGNKQHFQSK